MKGGRERKGRRGKRSTLRIEDEEKIEWAEEAVATLLSNSSEQKQESG